MPLLENGLPDNYQTKQLSFSVMTIGVVFYKAKNKQTKQHKISESQSVFVSHLYLQHRGTILEALLHLLVSCLYQSLVFMALQCHFEGIVTVRGIVKVGAKSLYNVLFIPVL